MTDKPKDQADSDELQKKINSEVLDAYLYGWQRRDKGLYARGGYVDEYTDQIMQLFADQQAADRKALAADMLALVGEDSKDLPISVGGEYDKIRDRQKAELRTAINRYFES